LAIEVDDRANAEVHRNMEADKIDSEGNYAVSLFQLIKVQIFVWGVDGGVKVDPLAFFIAAGRVRNFRGGSTPNPPVKYSPGGSRLSAAAG